MIEEKEVDVCGEEDEEIRENSREDKTQFFAEPYIKNLRYKIKTRGKYKTEDKKPKMIVIHYTVSPTKNKTSEQQAAGILSYFSRKGYGTLVMATDGQLYKGYNHELDEIAWHSGPSRWPTAPGNKNIHHYGLGIEVCCAGMVGKRRNGYHYAWHYENWNIGGKLKKGAEPVTNIEVRDFQGEHPQRPGMYEAFTKAQENSLINFCVWACGEFGISPDNIVGHDEIDTRGWKSDPGGSLSMTMKDFRKKIAAILASPYAQTLD